MNEDDNVGAPDDSPARKNIRGKFIGPWRFLLLETVLKNQVVSSVCQTAGSFVAALILYFVAHDQFFEKWVVMAFVLSITCMLFGMVGITGGLRTRKILEEAPETTLKEDETTKYRTPQGQTPATTKRTKKKQ